MVDSHVKKSGRGYFITLEGVEGVGKSTALQFIEQLFVKRGMAYRSTREPGGTPIAEAIRQIILTEHNVAMDPCTELLLFFAGRAQHLSEFIEPTLARGESVLCDRFIDASYAYQGAGRGVPAASIAALEAAMPVKLLPDLTFLLDAPPEICRQRLQQRNQEEDRIESAGALFFERVRKAYLARAAEFPKRFRVVDAAGSLADVQAQLIAGIDKLLQ